VQRDSSAFRPGFDSLISTCLNLTSLYLFFGTVTKLTFNLQIIKQNSKQNSEEEFRCQNGLGLTDSIDDQVALTGLARSTGLLLVNATDPIVTVYTWLLATGHCTTCSLLQGGATSSESCVEFTAQSSLQPEAFKGFCSNTQWLQPSGLLGWPKCGATERHSTRSC